MRRNWLLDLAICVSITSFSGLEEVPSLAFDLGWSSVQAQVLDGESGGMRLHKAEQPARELVSQSQATR
jgi:hypothetical protein